MQLFSINYESDCIYSNNCIDLSYIASSNNFLCCVDCFTTSRTYIWSSWFLCKLGGVGVICRAMWSLSVEKEKSFKEGLDVQFMKNR